ncbi:MAG: hypothetical protein ACLPN5_08645 [Roseiarcus sp.]
MTICANGVCDSAPKISAGSAKRSTKAPIARTSPDDMPPNRAAKKPTAMTMKIGSVMARTSSIGRFRRAERGL